MDLRCSLDAGYETTPGRHFKHPIGNFTGSLLHCSLVVPRLHFQLHLDLVPGRSCIPPIYACARSPVFLALRTPVHSPSLCLRLIISRLLRTIVVLLLCVCCTSTRFWPHTASTSPTRCDSSIPWARRPSHWSRICHPPSSWSLKKYISALLGSASPRNTSFAVLGHLGHDCVLLAPTRCATTAVPGPSFYNLSIIQDSPDPATAGRLR